MPKGLVNYNFAVVDYNGTAVPSGLSVTITNSVGATLTIYKQDESTSLTNPILSAAMDNVGVAAFWYSPGGVYATIDDGFNITRVGPIKEYDHIIKVPYLNLFGGMGTAGTPIAKTLADLKFIQLYLDNAATSGDNRLLYMRFRLTGTGGGGECLRAWTIVDDVVGGTARGAHISLSFDASGSLSGLGTALSATLHIPNAAMTGGTYAGIESGIWSDGASSTPAAVTRLAFLRCVADGNATGIAAVDDKAYLLDVSGITEGAGNMFVASATETNYASAARCLINGVEKWLMFASASG